MVRRLHLLLVIAAVATLAAGCDENETPAQQATPAVEASTEKGPFADIDGWIAYGDDNGIWAIEPNRPGGDRSDPVRLSDEPGEPVAWSRDGSKLLIMRRSLEGGTPRVTVSILNAEGVKKRVTRVNGYFAFASLSPEGLQVIYSTLDSGIYLANAEGEDPRLLMSRHLRWYASEKRSYRTELFAATFSPDGRQIAYVDGMGDWGNSIRVIDVEGGNVRVLVDWRRARGRQKEAMDNHVYRLAWSPDGSRLAFDTDDGIWVVGSDGSGLRIVIPHGHNPTWSPDGSRLAYATWNELGTWSGVRLRTADADGSHVQTFAHIDGDPESGWFTGPGPWNPIEPASG